MRLSRRFSQGAFYGPSFSKSLVDGCSVYSSFNGPFSNGHGLVLEAKDVIAALVSVLLKCARPSAISWLIAFASINSVNGVLARWFRPHVGIERFKAVRPFVANLDARATVARVVRRVRVVTSVLDVNPRAVFWAVSHSMTPLAFGCFLSLVAAAANGCPFAEGSGSNRYMVSTLANAEPFLSSGIFQRGQSTEVLAADIDHPVMERTHD